MLAPIFAGASSAENPRWEIPALLLKATAADALGDAGTSSRALQRALDLAEPDGLLLPFLLHPARDLLERQLRIRTAHSALISEILNLLSGQIPAARPEDVEPLREPLSDSELRVLRYLPTNLPAPEIAGELFVSLKVRIGEAELVQRAVDDMDEELRSAGEMRLVLADLRLAGDDPEGAAAALAPIFVGAWPIADPRWKIQALLLKASVDDALGDAGATSRALERALELAEPYGLLLPFLLYPTPDLVERHTRLRTTHASLISEILNLLSGQIPASRPRDVEPLREPLSDSELRVLRYLPTNLPAPEIAAELFVSLNTIRTHLRNVYAKLGVHSRADAVKRARELGLLSPSTPRR